MIPLLGYFFITYLTVFIKKRVRQLPIVIIIFIIVIGTVIYQVFTFLALNFSGQSINFWSSVSLIIIPSAVLNVVLSIPMYILISDIYGFIYPKLAEE